MNTLYASIGYLFGVALVLVAMYVILRSALPHWFQEPVVARPTRTPAYATIPSVTGQHKAIMDTDQRVALRAENLRTEAINATTGEVQAAWLVEPDTIPDPVIRPPIGFAEPEPIDTGTEPISWNATGEHRIHALVDDVETNAADPVETLTQVIEDLDARLAEAAAQLAIAYIDPMLLGLQHNGGRGTARDLAYWASLPVDSSDLTARTMRAMKWGLLRSDPDTGDYYLAQRRTRQPELELALDPDEAATLANALIDNENSE